MKNFSEQRFPTDISYGSMSETRFSTDIVTTSNGREFRNINFPTGRNRYNIGHGIRTKEQLDRVIEFFRAMRGRAVGFRFKDWIDYAVVGQQIAIADGETTQFQLIKTYRIDQLEEIRKITKPVKDTVRIYIDEVEVAVRVSLSTGMVKFEQAPQSGAVITADFEFDVPVRFDSDVFSANIDGYGVHSMNEITVIEVF